MDKNIEQKFEEFMKKAGQNAADMKIAQNLNSLETDNLAKVIRSEKDANTFMSELKTVIANQ